jgi:N-methylhydantoinase A
VLEAAYGVYRVATATMVRAVKAVSTYRGRDPRDFDLLAFGGNGPVFAVELARALEMRRVIIPGAAGLFSAFGLLEADLEQHYVQTVMLRGDDADPEALNRAFASIGRHARAGTNLHFADLRYRGQAFELTVPVPARALCHEDIQNLIEDFGREHERTYSHRAKNEPVEIVNVRVVSRATGGQPAMVTGNPREARARLASAGGTRKAFFGPAHGVCETPVLARRDLVRERGGPLIVEEYDVTTVLPPGCTARLDEHGSLVIDVDQ